MEGRCWCCGVGVGVGVLLLFGEERQRERPQHPEHAGQQACAVPSLPEQAQRRSQNPSPVMMPTALSTRCAISGGGGRSSSWRSAPRQSAGALAGSAEFCRRGWCRQGGGAAAARRRLSGGQERGRSATQTHKMKQQHPAGAAEPNRGLRQQRHHQSQGQQQRTTSTGAPSCACSPSCCAVELKTVAPRRTRCTAPAFVFLCVWVREIKGQRGVSGLSKKQLRCRLARKTHHPLPNNRAANTTSSTFSSIAL